jgi:alpha-tubulin suppressor-like RCC1 family protein
MINAAGSTCGVADDGAVYCWASEDSVATLVPGGVRLRTVSLGGPYLFTCGVAVDGAGYCWGANEVGQLGLGRADPVDAAWPTTPQRVVGGHRFRTISAGYEHACGVTEGGVAYCWGLNNYGRLGTGTARITPGVPAPVAGDLRFSTVSAAHDHSCGLTEAGAAYCWGHNDRGQLGTGSVGGPGTFSAVPVPVAGGLQFVTLAARSYHTCAVTAAGEAYCWGDNSSGQLGDGSPSPDRSRGPQPYRNDFRGVPTRVVHPRAFVGG